MVEQTDLAVIGAGAAGLAAGIFAAETARATGGRSRIVVLDGAQSIGMKILISGGGRCNVTHDEVRADDFNGSPTIIRNILAAFDERDVVRWFASLGVALKREETGKLFPTSDKARTVLDALLQRCRELDVEVRAGARVTGVERRNGFVVQHERGELAAKAVIMATGGRSLPRTGSDGGGWEIARALGHTVSDTFPALVPLVLDEHFFHARISGVSHEAELSTMAGGKLVDRRSGSLLWTHFGISGPVAMDVSRHWVNARRVKGDAEARLLCNFLPGRSFEQADRWLIDGAASRPRALVKNVVAEELPERLAAALVEHAGFDPALPAGQMTKEQRRLLSHELTGLPLPVVRDRGWNYAEVTAGGVPLNEIDARTMQSRRVPGLYLVGEMLECDGRIGGFNFQWAWSTGHIAGKAAGGAGLPHPQPLPDAGRGA